MHDKVRLNFYISGKFYEALAEMADRDDRSISDLIRDACRQYILKDKRKGTSKYFKEVITDGRKRDDEGIGEQSDS